MAGFQDYKTNSYIKHPLTKTTRIKNKCLLHNLKKDHKLPPVAIQKIQTTLNIEV